MNDFTVDRRELRSDQGSPVRCTPLPQWVLHQAWPEAPTNAEPFTDDGLLRLLFETQLGLLEPGVATHMHFVQRVLTRAGAERAAHLAVEFDPAHDRFELHHARVWRSGQCTEHARLDAIQTIRRETQLERRALNGRLTATLLIPDVRVDDQVEIAFTVIGSNPVLLGRCGSWIIFNAYGPCVETRHRIVRPLTRPIFLRAFNEPPAALVERQAETEDSRWCLKEQKRLTIEPFMPPWTVKNPCLQVTEFESWGEVSGLFAKYYADTAVPDDIAAALTRIAQTHVDPADRALEWLRFIQRELRYFALSLGEGGLIPRDLATIWAERFGDCKDAARLYVAGARVLGLDSCAALVSTTHGLSLREFLPSAQAFNHAIVRLRLPEGTFWLDPTLQRQGGRLKDLTLAYGGWALPLTLDVSSLEALPKAEPVKHLHCEDLIVLGPRVDSTVTMERRLEFRYWTADGVRNRVENEGTSKLGIQLLQDLQANWPNAIETAPLTVEDDFASNRLTAICRYELKEAWKRPDKERWWRFIFPDSFTAKELNVLKGMQRHSEILLGRPRRASWRARVRMPSSWHGTGWNQLYKEPGLEFRSTAALNKHETIAEHELTVDTWTMPPGCAEQYSRIVGALHKNATVLKAQVSFGKLQPVPGSGIRFSFKRWQVIWILIWLLLAAISAVKGHF